MRLTLLTGLILVAGLDVAAQPDVLIYEGDALPSESAAVQDILDPVAGSIATFADSANLAAALEGKEILVIPEQSFALPSELQAVGASWSGVLQPWVAAGGVVVQLDGFDSRHLLPAAGLISLSGAHDVSNQSVVVHNSSDPLAFGVPGDYVAAFDSVAYDTTDGVVVVRDSLNRAVVVNKAHGLGNVVVIGHDFSASNAAMEDLLVNAATRLPATVGGIVVSAASPLQAEGYVGGPFAGASSTVAISNATGTPQSFSVSVDQAWASASPTSGSIPAGGSVQVTVALTSAANALPAGSYSASITVANTTTAASRAIGATLQVNGVATVPFADGFESGAFGTAWRLTSTEDAQTTATASHGPNAGSRHALLTNANSGRLSRNELTLTADLSRKDGVVLSFAAKDFSPLSKSADTSELLQELVAVNPAVGAHWESFRNKQGGDATAAEFLKSLKSGEQAPTNPVVGGADADALLVSPDGVSWYEIRDFRTSIGQSYSVCTVDLDEAIGRYGLGYTNRFRIRFNHAGRYGIPADGLAFDDVSLTAASDDAIIVSPTTDPDFAGSAGGPFAPTGYGFDVTNSGNSVVTVNAATNKAFVAVSPAGFALTPGASQTVTVSTTAAAELLSPGIHDATLTVTNVSTSVARQRAIRVGVDTKRVVAFTRAADKAAGQEVEGTRAALDVLSTNYFWRQVDFSNELLAGLPQSDVVLVPDQDQGGALFAAGQSLSASMATWVQNGGVFIQCAEPSGWQFADGLDLIDVDSASAASGLAMVVANSADPIAQGVAAYTASAGSAAFATDEPGVVVETSGGLACVLNRRVGAGNAVLIGHDYEESNPDQDRILANAVFALPGGEDLRIGGDDISLVGFEGSDEQPTDSLLLENLGAAGIGWEATASATWLTIAPPSGTIPAGGSESATLSVDLEATGLPAGDYAADVVFTNVGSFGEQTRTVHLKVRDVASIPFFDGFEATALSPVWFVSGSGPFDADRTTIAANDGAAALGLASSVASSFARTEATLAVDVRGRNGCELSFSALGLGESANGPPPLAFAQAANFDGVAISADEENWFEVQELRRTLPKDVFGSYLVDLDAAMAATGIDNDGLLFVRFNQFGSAVLGQGGGILVDDVAITGGPQSELLVEFGSFEFAGPAGGPFVGDNLTITLRNTGDSPITWSADTSASWFHCTPSSGVLGPDLAILANISLIGDATTLGQGYYSDMIDVANQTAGITTSRVVELKVAPRNVLLYTEFADRFVETPHTLDAVRDVDPNFVTREAASVSELVSSLSWADVLLVPEVVSADNSTLLSRGLAMSAALDAFLAQGKMIVVLAGSSGSGSGFKIVEGAGLAPATATTAVPLDAPLEIEAPDDPIAHMLVDYEATERTIAMQDAPGVSLVSADGGSIATRILEGGGEIVLIGHSFRDTVQAQSRLLHNAIFHRPDPPVAEIAVFEADAPILDGETVPVDFGVVVLGSTAPTRTFTVNNLGFASLSTSTPSLPAGYALEEGLSSSIPGEGSDSFTVSLSTAARGTFAGDVSIANGDADENPYNFAVTGTVILPGDADGNGTVTAADAQAAFECFLDGGCANGVDPLLADIFPDDGDGCVDPDDGNGVVTPGDAQRIFEVFLGVQTTCP